MVNQRYHFAIFLIIVSIVIVASGCNTAADNKPLDQITVQLSWFHTAEFAGFYVAAQQGFYAAENLDVTLVAGGPEVNPVAEVLAGNAQFGVTAGDNIIRARANGDEVTAVASIYQHSPLIVMALADSDIKRPQDLVGKTVGVISPNLDTTWDIQFVAMLNHLGIDIADMTLIPIENYHGAAELVSGRMDAASGFFSINEPVQARLDGDEITTIFYSDYGILLYANPIFTTNDLINTQPDLVQRFVRATIRGYLLAIEQPEQTVTDVLQYDANLTQEGELATLLAQIPLINTGYTRVGQMEANVWQTTADILLEQNVITTPVNINTVYTNTFIDGMQQ
ncbi:MAG: ABC transporter substrate-binding protein [Anaerolinea sp.]|nr:ABC transporter substrate-binding protein [Anaerolinea sp.]